MQTTDIQADAAARAWQNEAHDRIFRSLWDKARDRSLTLAIEHFRGHYDTTPATMVTAAEVFFAFLSGQSAPTDPEDAQPDPDAPALAEDRPNAAIDRMAALLGLPRTAIHARIMDGGVPYLSVALPDIAMPAHRESR